MIGAIVGAVGSLASSIVGGIAANKARKKQQARLDQQKQELESWYNRNYNEDTTQRADAQRMLTKTSDAIRQRNRQAEGRQAVMGGSQETLEATQQTNNQALAETASQIAAASADRKDKIDAQYMSQKDKLNQDQAKIDEQQAANIQQTYTNAGNVLRNVGSALDSTVKAPKQTYKTAMDGKIDPVTGGFSQGASYELGTRLDNETDDRIKNNINS